MNRKDLFRAIGDAAEPWVEEMEQKKPAPRRWARWSVAAACLCIAVAAAAVVLPRQNTNSPAPVTSIQNTQNTCNTEIVSAAPHNILPDYRDLPQLTYGESGGELAADIAFPDGYFFRTPTAEQLLSIWKQTPDAEGAYTADAGPWLGYDLPTAAKEGLLTYHADLIYDGEGRVWVAQLFVTLANGDTLNLRLSPDQVPLSCLVYDGGETCQINGVSVTALRYGDGNREVSFLSDKGSEAVGVRIDACGVSEELEEVLIRLVNTCLSDGGMQLSQLSVSDVPEWRSETLTEEEARAEGGAYLPETLPSGYAFESAHRELGEGRNWLSACWFRDYSNLHLCIYWDQEPNGLVHAEEIEKYDQNYYDEMSRIPDEAYDSWMHPTFYAEELTMEVIERRMSDVDMGQAHASFSVLYPDGVILSVSVSAPRDRFPALLSFLLDG